ncbi:hypothetical protein CsSME_00054055 [Camellia sinensis var. sinensis]
MESKLSAIMNSKKPPTILIPRKKLEMEGLALDPRPPPPPKPRFPPRLHLSPLPRASPRL